MAPIYIDRRRTNNHKSVTNRQRFIERARDAIKKQVDDVIRQRDVKDIGSGEDIKIPRKTVGEPNFSYGKGGKKEHVLPGNKDFIRGDQIGKSGEGSGKGKQASDSGDGEDEFAFTLTRDEFLDFFFSDLELPDLVKRSLKDLETTKPKRAGISTSGIPANMNILRSMKNAIGRNMALAAAFEQEITTRKEQLANVSTDEKRKSLEKEIEEYEQRKRAILFLDEIDLRYNAFEQKPTPITKAVMFCIMDVSGSMGEHEKDLAKRFFMLLYLFLQKKYEKIDVVFIKHHTHASTVSEEDFFYSRENGGTIVSSAMEEVLKHLQNGYSRSEYNIYCSQISDGDNWPSDNEKTMSLLHQIMPHVQYYAYIEVGEPENQNPTLFSVSSDDPSDLWEDYATMSETYPQFNMKKVNEARDIYPVFRELFSKQGDK